MTARLLARRMSAERSESALRYRIEVQFCGIPESDCRQFFYEITGDHIPLPSPSDDFIAIALVFFAMRHGYDLHIDGPLSTSLLANLHEFQSAWALWQPGRYKVIDIVGNVVNDDTHTTNNKGVVAFSGGVDATYAMLRHSTHSTNRYRCPLVCAVLVRGFDIGLTCDAAWQTALANAQAVTTLYKVPLSAVRTNWKEVICGFWEDEFFAGLASCLSLFSAEAGVGIAGSDEDYASFVIPWGSNPVTNPMLSSRAFRMFSEGGSHTRTQKVEAIAMTSNSSEYLRVCWEGPQTGYNCGVCEKCVRTKLNFLALGLDIPKSLGVRPKWREIVMIRAYSKVQISYLSDIQTIADSNPGSPIFHDVALRIALARLKVRASAAWLVRKFFGLRRRRP